MKHWEKLADNLKNGVYSQAFAHMYPINAQDQPERYRDLIDGFTSTLGTPPSELRLFSSPGRTELGGNHTDHQHGRILAAAVHMDTAAVACGSGDSMIRIYSKGFGIVEVSLDSLEKKDEERNTTAALIRGVCAKMTQMEYRVGGFWAFCDSQVPVGSGLSSSAAFENLVTTILNMLYNQGVMDPVTVAQIGQYAENVYFGKPSGLMDQAASSVGSVITVDFKNPQQPEVAHLPLDLNDYGYHLCIVNTGGDHANLTQEYAAIFHENRQVSEFFGKEYLREVDEEAFYQQIPALREQLGERAVLRAMHYFGDHKRVKKQVAALEANDFEMYLKLVLESGASSFAMLQNIFACGHPSVQPVTLALQYSQKLLAEIGGAWRVHGGGFAGTIQAYVPHKALKQYCGEMDRIFGKHATQVLAIRPVGSVEVLANDEMEAKDSYAD